MQLPPISADSQPTELMNLQSIAYTGLNVGLSRSEIARWCTVRHFCVISVLVIVSLSLYVCVCLQFSVFVCLCLHVCSLCLSLCVFIILCLFMSVYLCVMCLKFSVFVSLCVQQKLQICATRSLRVFGLSLHLTFAAARLLFRRRVVSGKVFTGLRDTSL